MTKRNQLTARDIGKKSRQPGRISDGNGLYLNTSKTLTQSWLFRYTLFGKASWVGLGSTKDLSLAEARQAAIDTNIAIREGRNPKESGSMTFTKASAEYITSHSPAWKNAKHKQQWENTLKTYADPVIGRIPVDEITLDRVLAVLTPIWYTKTETASRVRMRIENILAWATVKGYRQGFNPAVWRGNLDAVLPPRSKIQQVKHFAAIPYTELPQLYSTLVQSNSISALALCFTILTAARSGEVRKARWDEIQDDVWIIPPERMKAGKEHCVPLSKQALRILKRVKRQDDFIFVGPSSGKPLSDSTMSKYLKSHCSGITVHGFRSTFRDWVAEETDYPNHVAEMALAHTIKNQVEAAYRRGTLLHKRKSLMQDWSAYISNSAKASLELVTA